MEREKKDRKGGGGLYERERKAEIEQVIARKKRHGRGTIAHWCAGGEERQEEREK